MLRILMVTNLFYPLTGGSENVVFETSQRLVRRGHDVHVLTERTKPDWPLYECVEGIHIHRGKVNFDNSITRFISGVSAAAQTFKRLASGQAFDLLHFHLTLPSVGVLLCRESRQSSRIASFYGPWDEEELVEKKVRPGWHPSHIKATIFRGLQKAVLRHSARIITLSDYSRSQVAALAGLDEQCALIPGGVDINRFRPATDRSHVRTRLQLPQNRTLLLTVRRLVPRMGVDTLIDAMPGILAKHPDVSLIIGGDGPLRPDLERRVDTLHLRDHIRFTGFIPAEELPLHYQAADLFVMPTKALEGFGLPIIEAMACGTPAIGTAIGSIREIIGAFDPRLLIPEATPQAITETVQTCFRAEILEDRFRMQCRQHVESRYDWERIVDTLEQTYRSVCRDSPGERLC